MIAFSYTGIALRMRRKSLGQLLSGFFYPSAAFALLSMISFLIKPDMVSSFLDMVSSFFLSINFLNSEFCSEVCNYQLIIVNYALIYR